MKVVMLSGKYTPVNPKDWTEELDQREQNIILARQVAMHLWSLGYAVICPQTNSAHFDHVAPAGVFYDGYLEVVKRSDILVMLPEWEESAGAVREKIKAEQTGKEIYFAERCKDGWKFVDNTGKIWKLSKGLQNNELRKI